MNLNDVYVFIVVSLSTRAMRNLEEVLEETELNETTSMSEGRLMAVLHRPRGPFRGLEFHASDKEVRMLVAMSNWLKYRQFLDELAWNCVKRFMVPRWWTPSTLLTFPPAPQSGCNTFQGNLFICSQDISLKAKHFQPDCGAGEKVKGSAELVEFIIWKQWMFVHNFKAIHSSVVKIFH